MRTHTYLNGATCPTRLAPGNVVRITTPEDNYYNRSAFHPGGNLATVVATHREDDRITCGFAKIAYIKWPDDGPLVELARTASLEYVGRAVGAW